LLSEVVDREFFRSLVGHFYYTEFIESNQVELAMDRSGFK